MKTRRKRNQLFIEVALHVFNYTIAHVGYEKDSKIIKDIFQQEGCQNHTNNQHQCFYSIVLGICSNLKSEIVKYIFQKGVTVFGSRYFNGSLVIAKKYF